MLLMSAFAWLAGCLLDREGYLERRSQLVDLDGDGFVAEDDCDDGNAAISPDAQETCDGVDQDCDGRVDDDPVDPSTWYSDSDGDGYGDPLTQTDACDAPATTWTNRGDDCDDTDVNAFPGGEEVAYDGIDQDCDGADLVDVDGDGHAGDQAGGDDCDDGDATVYAGAVETPYDGIDQDCSGGDEDDLDGDGVMGEAAGGDDCDDADASVFPGAEETWANGYKDNDCDGDLGAATLEYGGTAWVGESAGAELGYRVSALGDVDGDGRAEYLAVALFESGTYSLGGEVYLLGGGGGGGSVTTTNSLVAGGDEWFLGASVHAGGDLSGDGVPDFVVGADGYGASRRGHTWVVSGGALASTPALSPDTGAIGVVWGEEDFSYSGHATGFLGDLLGDGGDWLGVTAPYATAFETAGAGRLAGFAALLGDVQLSDGDLQVSGYYEGAHLGVELSPAGDEDGDGLDDYMLASESGDVAVILPGGLLNPVLPDDAIFRLTRSSSESDDRVDPFLVGDVDGDGRRDLAAVHNNTLVYFYTHLATNPVQVITDATSSVDFGADSLAYSVADLGDLDADGRDETFLPASHYGAISTSYAVIWPGSMVSFGATNGVEDASLGALSTQARCAFGYRVAVSDDVDGDGTSDIILGGPGDCDGAAPGGGVLTIPVPH